MQDFARPAIRPKEAAEMLGCSHRTIRNYWAKGLLDGFLTRPGSHGQLWIYRDSVEAFDQKRRTPDRAVGS